MWVLDISGDPVNLDRMIGITRDQSENHVQAVYGPDWYNDRTIIFEGTPEEAKEYHARLTRLLTAPRSGSLSEVAAAHIVNNDWTNNPRREVRVNVEGKNIEEWMREVLEKTLEEAIRKGYIKPTTDSTD